ncbi:hypothetical protein [Rickettsiella endosymbiont of Rhagonycha lignosa]|uniref:hypothetical protein n=1 Tax=Rickettsiella endosymbiont of Rhagonycha lignosa TaxID=3077937 RepID=UPI00313BCEF8
MADSPDYFGGTVNSENYNSRLAKANNKLTALKKDSDQKPYEKMIKKMYVWIALEEEKAIQFMLATNDQKYRLFSPEEARKKRDKFNDSTEYHASNYEAAKNKLAEYFQTDLATYQEILNRGRSAANTPYALEAIERATPVQAPSQPTGKFRDNGEFIALSIMSCLGPFSNKMHEAFENAGDTISGKFIAAKQKLEFYYEVTCVPYQPDARDITAFVSEIHNTFSVSYNPKTNASKPADIIHCVNTSYVTHSKHTGLAYQKKGTCRIKARYDKKNLKVIEQDSRQYDEGKEMMPVRYRKGA